MLDSLALLMDDPDAPAEEPFSHWMLYNLPIDWRGLPDDFQPERDGPGERGRNSIGNTSYERPCPPLGERHRYYFRLYAVGGELDLGEGTTRAHAIHVLERTELSRTCQRSGAGNYLVSYAVEAAEGMYHAMDGGLAWHEPETENVHIEITVQLSMAVPPEAPPPAVKERLLPLWVLASLILIVLLATLPSTPMARRPRIIRSSSPEPRWGGSG